jgi:DNA helicase-2/ATP-dependent DNA helicase PcrA
LEKYIEKYRESFQLPKYGWALENLGRLGLTITLDRTEIENAYLKATSKDLSLVQQREYFINDLVRFLKEKYELSVGVQYEKILGESVLNNYKELLNFENNDREERLQQAKSFRNKALQNKFYKNEVLDIAKSKLIDKVSGAWKQFSIDCYFDFLRNTDLLYELGRGIFEDEEIQLLNSSKSNSKVIDIEDIPALFYLYLLAYGKKDVIYDHIVVDEAQDFSPLQFHILKMYNPNNSMTIVGDIAQGIYAHRGLNRWNELKEVFSGGNYQYKKITQNYRSTREIVEFANEINLKIRGKETDFAKAFNRKGLKPKVVKINSKECMYRLIDADIYELMGKGIKNIAVIAKSGSDCLEAQKFLIRNRGYSTSLILNRDGEYDYEGGVVILPMVLSKGIEFEAVIICDANTNKFDKDTNYDGRLLYVAATRALHELIIYSVGQPTFFLESAIKKAEFINFN